MREEYLRMKRKGQEDHQKMRECVASPLILAQCTLWPPLFSKFPERTYKSNPLNCCSSISCRILRSYFC